MSTVINLKGQTKRREAAHAFDRDVGARIKTKRQAAGLTQTDLGKKIGFSVPQVSKFESGDVTCEPATLAMIAAALGCKASDFVDGIKVGK